jgi:hypothetical protein
MKYYSKITAFLSAITLVTSMSLAPALSYAKDHGDGNGNNGRGHSSQSTSIQASAQSRSNGGDEQGDDNNQGNNNENGDQNGTTSCLTSAFGHLIAPGWIKHNGQMSVGNDCNLPPGIGRHGDNDNDNDDNGQGTTTATSTPDTTPPVLSSIIAVTGTSTAQISWMTNESATSKVYYSASSSIDVSASSTLFISDQTLVKSHVATISGLIPSTTYYFIVESADASGNVARSSVFSATTGASNTTSAPVISSIVTVPGSTGIQVNWTTDQFATSKVYYSATSTIDADASTTAFVSTGSLSKDHSLSVTGLSTSTPYYFIIESANQSGQMTRSAVFSASTTAPAADTTPPVISAALAIVGSTDVQLSWTTDEAATTKAYYSTSTPVDINASSTVSVSNVSLVTAHALTVSGLATSTMYHMILESADASGNVAHSSEFSFTTGM